ATPDPAVVKEYKADLHAEWARPGTNDGPIDPSTDLICEVKQLPAFTQCDSMPNSNGWCYVEQTGTNGCPQAILFTQEAAGHDVVTSLQCLESSDVDGG